MADYQVMVDNNRHTFLFYRDVGKTKHYISTLDGKVDIVALGREDQRRLKPCKSTPEHYAEIFLKSHLEISRAARAILRGILGHSEALTAPGEGPSFSGSVVTIAEISESLGKPPNKCRKFLRKLVDKPGGRWEWSAEEAEKVKVLLIECFSREE